MSAPFRSWVEDYVAPPPAAGPVPEDVRAFIVYRAQQRGQTRANLDPTTRHGNAMRHAVARAQLASVRGQEARSTGIEQAKLHLQRCGFVVYAAIVTNGPRDHWKVVGRRDLLTDGELLDLARAKGFGGVR